MAMHDGDPAVSPSEGAAFPWILEHLLSYPGTYEIPLRTMYTLNSTTQTQQSTPASLTLQPVAGNAFPRGQHPAFDEQQNFSTATAAAQLRANLMSHISNLPSQPSSLPPSFVTSFVRRCFAPDLADVDFPQALTALDYLKDLEVRRRREVLAALDRLGVDKNDLGQKEVLGKKYPGVLRWVVDIEDKERKVEASYTQVYLGLRRWTLINELSLTPFNKANCLAMLNTLYPPTTMSTQFVQPTAQLTPQVLATQRDGFFRYITAVDRNGTKCLKSLMSQNRREGESSGWPSLRETLDKYLRMANDIIDECFEITGRDSLQSPTAASFSSVEFDDQGRRKVDSGLSFTSSSNRGSVQSHETRPSTCSSVSTHGRNQSKDKPLPPGPPTGSIEAKIKPAGSTLERIAREIRKIRSRGDLREASRSRPRTAVPVGDAHVSETQDAVEKPPATPSKDRKLRNKMSLKNMRSNSALKEKDANSRSNPSSREGGNEKDAPAFDVEEMKRRRMIWEAQRKKKEKHNSAESMEVDT